MEQALPIYTDWLSRSILNYEKLAKSAVPHRGEKGRIVEGAVKSALRTILPLRFSIGTGFVINSKGQISSQLDIVVYDNVWNAPIMLEGGVGLFPIECVYGFVEVKSRLDARETRRLTKAIRRVRDLAEDKCYVQYRPRKVRKGRYVAEGIEFPLSLPPRAFALCTDCAANNFSRFVEKLRTQSEANGSHIHGLAILGKDWFVQQVPHAKPYKFRTLENDAFQKFCLGVLSAIQSMPMFSASMGRYSQEG